MPDDAEAPTPDILIRPAHETEYGDIGRLIVDAYSTIPHITTGGYDETLRNVAAWAPQGEPLVATGPDHVTIFGTATFAPPGSELTEFDDREASSIRFMAVRGDARGKGVGSALTSACIEKAQRVSPRLRIHTSTEMTDAQRMYERFGFVRDPATDWTPEPDVHLLGYVLEFGAS
jgi:GNAT superfamily N-acetyltransferase